jgi:hypothetical protein
MRHFIPTLCSLASLSVLSLQAATSVTSSAGDNSPGTLSAAIGSINTGSTTSPIQIESGVTVPKNVHKCAHLDFVSLCEGPSDLCEIALSRL